MIQIIRGVFNFMEQSYFFDLFHTDFQFQFVFLQIYFTLNSVQPFWFLVNLTKHLLILLIWIDA